MAQSRKRLDLITIRRASVDLYGQQAGGRLEDMGSFAKYLAQKSKRAPTVTKRPIVS
jgi:hypothetical protein